MLTQINISNFVIVENLELSFGEKLTVITGETGAGKSIIFDALNLCLGERADAGQVRNGTDQADIYAYFDISNIPNAKAWLSENDIPIEDELLLRRVVHKEGRSKSYINGHPSPLSKIKELGQNLVTSHGQHDHYALFDAKVQLALLDGIAGVDEQKQALAKEYKNWQQLVKKQDELKAQEQSRQDRISLLSYQLSELDEFGLAEGEYDSMCQQQTQLAHADEVQSIAQESLDILFENEQFNVVRELSRQVQKLEALSDYHSKLPAVIEQLQSSQVQLEEMAFELREVTQTCDSDPENLSALDERIGTAHDLARKHQVKPEELPSVQAQIDDELKELRSNQTEADELSELIENAWQRYFEKAQSLSAKRHKASASISKQVCEYLAKLNMKGATFEASLESCISNAGATGIDKINFLASANTGQAPGPIQKVLSGGELSRLALSISLIGNKKNLSPTILFDEVDVGIGGNTAAIVGELLRQLGEQTQVFCVTHQPQVASQGHRHLSVSKSSQNNQTSSAITVLDTDERVNEIARMIAGQELTDNSIAHARDMLAEA